MHQDDEINKICDDILKSKKYSFLYKPFVLRICNEQYYKYPTDKERIKNIKNTLHSMFGAYLNADCFKKIDKLLNASGGEYKNDNINNILSLHASTNERLVYLSEFYNCIFNVTGAPETILDVGCGFNPLTMPYFPQKPVKYYAYDVDTRIAEINNRFFLHNGMPELAGCADIAAKTPEAAADAAFIFKLLPLIERQAKERSLKLLQEINARYLVVTYPTKSLGGKEKGMQKFYSAAFENIIGGVFDIADKQEIGTEMIYIIDKGRQQ